MTALECRWVRMGDCDGAVELRNFGDDLPSVVLCDAHLLQVNEAAEQLFKDWSENDE